jgi:tetratricopeptide (TPR) repeat protein
MLREIADALEVFAERHTLLLVLEDLHWSDPSTADLLGCLARRRQPARLLLIGSLRAGQGAAADHPVQPIRHDLQAKGLCEEVALPALSADDVRAYLEARFAGARAAALRRLAVRVHQRTEGNPLFMLNMVNDLLARGLLVWRERGWDVDGSIDRATEEIPAGLRELIDRAVQDLAPSARQTLEAASVVGDEFAVAAVAAALQAEPDRVEDVCEQLAGQRGLIVDAGIAEWPDGSVSGRYRFRHALYRQVLYERIAAARRVRLHRAIGRRLEAGFGAAAAERAAELAMHFERGHAHARALHYHERAAAAALDRHAAHEAVAHCTAALAALAHAPEKPERAGRELALVVTRATLLMAINGYGAAETERAFARARALCDVLPAGPQRYAVLRGLLSYHQVRAALGEARGFGDQLLGCARERADDRVLEVQAHYGQGTTLFHLAAFDEARRHLELALDAYDPASHRQHIRVYGGYDPGVACALWLGWTLILQGEIDAALERSQSALALAERHGDAFTLAYAHHGVGVSHQLLGDWAASEQACAAAMRLGEEHGFPHVLGMATVGRGWAVMMQGRADVGVPMLRDGVAQVERSGAVLVRPSYLGMLAAAHVLEGDRAAALARFDEALAEVERTGERLHEAPLLVGKSHLLAAGPAAVGRSRAAGAAEECLRRALAVARAQGARLLELRAALALARHCQARERGGDVRAALEAASAWFEAHDSAAPELAAARRLLASA